MIAATLPGIASAATPANDSYLADSTRDIVKSGYGVCWHSGYWTSAMAIAECDAVAAKDEVKPLPKESAIQPKPATVQAKQAKIPPTKINYSADSLFDFDKSVLKPNGKVMLDGFVRELDGATYEVINVTGYTDRIGSTKYNQKLSLRRADEVKDYLVKNGVPADRIKAEGEGKMHPVTKTTDCRGMTKARAIACLQPDRRMEVTVTGTKESVASQR